MCAVFLFYSFLFPDSAIFLGAELSHSRKRSINNTGIGNCHVGERPRLGRVRRAHEVRVQAYGEVKQLCHYAENSCSACR